MAVAHDPEIAEWLGLDVDFEAVIVLRANQPSSGSMTGRRPAGGTDRRPPRPSAQR